MNLIGFNNITTSDSLNVGFLIPIFESDGQYYNQIIDENGFIVAFKKSNVSEVKHKLNFHYPVPIGNLAIYSVVDNEKISFGNKENMIPIIKSIILKKENSPLFTLIEFYEFCDQNVEIYKLLSDVIDNNDYNKLIKKWATGQIKKYKQFDKFIYPEQSDNVKKIKSFKNSRLTLIENSPMNTDHLNQLYCSYTQTLNYSVNYFKLKSARILDSFVEEYENNIRKITHYILESMDFILYNKDDLKNTVIFKIVLENLRDTYKNRKDVHYYDAIINKKKLDSNKVFSLNNKLVTKELYFEIENSLKEQKKMLNYFYKTNTINIDEIETKYSLEKRINRFIRLCDDSYDYDTYKITSIFQEYIDNAVHLIDANEIRGEQSQNIKLFTVYDDDDLYYLFDDSNSSIYKDTISNRNKEPIKLHLTSIWKNKF